MNSTFGSLNIAMRTLQSMQRSIEVTGHNVANAATAGYSRQKPMLVSGDPYSIPAANRYQSLGQIGTGVTLEKIQRYRSNFLDSQIRQETLTQKGWEVRQDALQQIEVALNEPSDSGLNAQLGAFWNAWRSLASTPENSAARGYVAETTATFTAAMRETTRQLGDLQAELDNRVGAQVTQINDLAHQIANLNETVRQVQGVGQQANDLRDERDKLLTELSGIININAYETETGSVTVNLGNHALVMDQVVSELAIQQDPANTSATTGQMLKQVVWAKSGAAVQVAGISLAGGLSAEATDRLGGELGGILIARDLLVSDQLNHLNTLATTLIGAVNGLHQTGYGLNNLLGGGLTATSPVPGTVNGFSLVAPTAGQSGLADSTYYVEVRDDQNSLEFRLVDGTGQPVTIADAAAPGTMTSSWQAYPLSGGTFDTGRGLAIDFAPLTADHSVGSINTNMDVNGFTTTQVHAGLDELGSSTYYVEVRYNGTSPEFRLVDSAGEGVSIYDGTASDGRLTQNWQPIPAGATFDTGRGLTVQFTTGPYEEAVRGGSGTPPPYPAASVDYTARSVQLGTRGDGAASATLSNFLKGNGAATIALSDTISADYSRIATAATPNSPGDGSIALKIAQLSEALLLQNGTLSLGDYYRAGIAQLGQQAEQADVMSQNHELLGNYLQSRQDEIAGVSVDEEMVFMLEYQRTYQAAARVITTVDEMLDKVINGMGIVGR